jgi:hypothetical protein
VTVLAVDLAAKYSAACLMTSDYRVTREFDSWGRTEEQFIAELHDAYQELDVDTAIIEDLPHGLRYSTLIKTVCRLQGRIYHAFRSENRYAADDVIFAAPNQWRHHFGLKRGTGPDIVVPTAAEFGYTAPDLTERAKVKGGRAIARKVATDYCAAYLIARWAVDMKDQNGTYEVAGTSRYNTEVIRKKDVDAENR